jgi:hypothetical protein
MDDDGDEPVCTSILGNRDVVSSAGTGGRRAADDRPTDGQRGVAGLGACGGEELRTVSHTGLPPVPIRYLFIRDVAGQFHP